MLYPSDDLYPANDLFPDDTPDVDLTLTATLEDSLFELVLDGDPLTLLSDPDPWQITLEADVPRTIRASIGDAVYVSALVTETAGIDLTGTTFEASLGSSAAPGSWHAPDAVDTVAANQRRVKLLVGAGQTVNPAPGTYWLWVRAISAPETESLIPADFVTIA